MCIPSVDLGHGEPLRFRSFLVAAVVERVEACGDHVGVGGGGCILLMAFVT